MTEHKSFWTWFVKEIRKGLQVLLHSLYNGWYIVFIFIGAWIALFSSIYASWIYQFPSWVSLDIGFAEPKIMPWMIIYPSIGVVIFMFGLYGHWRGNIRTLEQMPRDLDGGRTE